MNNNTPDICRAIGQRIVLQFVYKGKKREIEPFTYGYYASTGRYVLCGYQVGGGSNSGKKTSWRSYDLDEIQNLSYTAKKARRHRRGYNAADNRMTRIYCNC